ncbi:ATP-grasp fold amidoligase family protein [uncultured Ruegeria sp.]|uniref:ATP-grasp fold amidoligase family protein n=1 Tax=uncultured Ruegeria sp. TaxID=259304 RepID=UPI00262DD260|nr:ATP-grasp fold amidoligase family protein [uncultured Ruegeria sp.]
MVAENNLPTIGMLWLEGPLSFLEQMCLLSFVSNGHKVVLFHYGEVENVPEGIELVSANEIHEPKQFIVNSQFKTPVPQSDIFRLQLMKKTDFLWCDTDVISLAPIPKADHIFGYFNNTTICNAIMRLPADSPALQAYTDYSLDPFPIRPWIEGDERHELERQKAAGELPHASDQAHSVYGPGVLTWFLRHHGEIDHASPVSVFYPLPFRHTGQANDIPAREFRRKYLTDDTLAVHLWGRRMRWWVNKGIKRHSFLDRRLRGLGVSPADAPLPRKGKEAPKKIEFPSNLPELRLSKETISQATNGIMSVAQISTSEQFLKVAQFELDKIKSGELYGVNEAARPGHQRGWDHYENDAARLNALSMSLSRFANNQRYLPDLSDPKTITEKLLVMKLFGDMPKVSAADKLTAESFVPQPSGNLLTPVQRYWDSSSPVLPEELELEPGSYWLKCNNGQGQNHRLNWPMSKEESELANEKLTSWSKKPIPHGYWAAEWWYSTIDTRFFIEENLAAEGEDIIDWKFWVVAGKLQMVQVDRDRSRGHVQMIHDRDFNFIPKELYFKTSEDTEPRPKRYDDMVQIAEAIGQRVEFARVDLYAIGDKIYLGEITLCPFGGKRKMRTPELDKQLGDAWTGTRLFPN